MKNLETCQTLYYETLRFSPKNHNTCKAMATTHMEMAAMEKNTLIEVN